MKKKRQYNLSEIELQAILKEAIEIYKSYPDGVKEKKKIAVQIEKLKRRLE